MKSQLQLLLIASVVASASMLAGCGKAPRLEPARGEQLADHIVVVKSTHTMTLFSKGKILRVYNVALGRGRGGAKDHRGDHETPEGQYTIDGKNAQSRFHLGLHVSYPNALDLERARKEGRQPGGAIMIHGVEDQFAWLGALHRIIDWTDGCIGVTDKEIEEIWRLVPVGTPIEIKA